MIDQETLKKFDYLYNETYKDILNYVVCNCSNAEDIKDIIQNIYIDLLKKINDNVPINNEKAYVLGIAKNKIKSYYRFHYKNKLMSLFSSRDDELNALENIPEDFNIEDDFLQKEDIKFIWDFLKRKKIIIFQIFYLYYYENMSIKNISKKLNISESNVKHYLYRTLNELKVLMKSRGDKNV